MIAPEPATGHPLPSQQPKKVGVLQNAFIISSLRDESSWRVSSSVCFCGKKFLSTSANPFELIKVHLLEHPNAPLQIIQLF
uniref:AlNc14C72G4920 protein n=1 Tax=Albugo laibachii Nc14 TaxID=890382 RepID=F0WE64_9STRA|nr:AlNc14C72G4920 [Albugo laibachii Nc14]|eukprot:CCA19493.1 AlNc14C72G4920 [Albugo laibachii Nc14]